MREKICIKEITVLTTFLKFLHDSPFVTLLQEKKSGLMLSLRAVPKAETGGESVSRPYGREGRTAEDSSTLDIIGNS
jgi:hypothetical protein